MVKDSDQLAFWGERVRSFTEINTLSRQGVPARVIRRSTWRRHLHIDQLEEPTIHVEHLRAATPDSSHDWRRIDPLTSFENLWPTFQSLARACDEDAFAVIELPYRQVATDSDWQWADGDLQVREFSAETTWHDLLEASDEIEGILGPFFTIDRMMVAGSGGSWCLIYTEVPDVECWVTTTDRAPQGAREMLLQA